MQRSPHFLIPAEAGNLSVDQTQGVSLYIQVANILRYTILSGAIAQVLDCRRWSNSVIASRWPALPFKAIRVLLKKDFSSLAEGVASMSYSIRRRASLFPNRRRDGRRCFQRGDRDPGR